MPPNAKPPRAGCPFRYNLLRNTPYYHSIAPSEYSVHGLSLSSIMLRRSGRTRPETRLKSIRLLNLTGARPNPSVHPPSCRSFVVHECWHGPPFTQSLNSRLLQASHDATQRSQQWRTAICVGDQSGFFFRVVDTELMRPLGPQERRTPGTATP